MSDDGMGERRSECRRGHDWGTVPHRPAGSCRQPDSLTCIRRSGSAGYRVIGPRVRAGAISLAELESAAELPFGWGVTLSPGGYRLRERDDQAAFGHSAGPGSWKEFLHPPRERLWSADARPGRSGFAADEPTSRLDGPDRLSRRPPLRPARDPDPGPRARRTGASGFGLRQAPGAGLHRGGELHRARRDVLLHLDGHRAAGGARAMTCC